METPKFQKRQFTPTEDAITRFFIEKDLKSLNYRTPEEAQAYVDEINTEYGDIAFVSEDRGGFAVKFKAEHLNHESKEYKPEEKGNNGNIDLEKAA